MASATALAWFVLAAVLAPAAPGAERVATAAQTGYWLVGSDGGVFSYGTAAFHGSTGAIKLNRPIVGMAARPTGKGYWMVASDGGIFSFGDAPFHGSTGAIRLNQPITAMAATPSGRGYWMGAVDGGVFSFGDAAFFGAGPERPPAAGTTRRVAALVPTPSGKGYWQVAATGEVLAFGDAPALGQPASVNRDVVGMATLPSNLGAPQFFASVPNPTWGTAPSVDPVDVGTEKAGKVVALAEAGDLVFMAGEFVGVTPPGTSWKAAVDNPSKVVPRPYLVALNRHTGALVESWDAQPDNHVLALATSPDGTKLYVGGRFRSIGGAPAGRIAVLDVETGQQDPTFQPPVASSSVKALALHGDTLYVGGDFGRLDDTPRPGLAALDAATGALRTAWVPPARNDGCFKGHTGVLTLGCLGQVQDLAITDDAKSLYVAGDFADFGGRGHGGLLSLDAKTGSMTSWQAVNDRPIFGLTIWPGDNRSLVASAGGTGGRVNFYEYKASGRSTRPKWNHKVDGDATDVVATRERVYLVGHYNFVLGSTTVCGAAGGCTGSVANGDTSNRHLSVFNARSGSHDRTFTAQENTPHGPQVALVGKDHLYVGGDFTDIDDKHIDGGGTEYKQPGFVQFPALADGR